jgi:hypothetical protein
MRVGLWNLRSLYRAGSIMAVFATAKNLKVKIRCSHIAASINILGRLQVGKPTIRLTIFLWRRRHSNVLDVRSFRAADYDSDHYVVVAKGLGRD